MTAEPTPRLSLSDPTERHVLEDWLSQRGRNLNWLAWQDVLFADAGVAADSDAAGDSADSDDSAADADAADSDAFKENITNAIQKGAVVREGLTLFQVPGRYYYGVTIIGWVRHVGGDELEVLGQCTVLRTGQPVSLSDLAVDGPGSGHSVSKPSRTIEQVHRLTIRRPIVADEKAWKKHCPKPKDWVER